MIKNYLKISWRHLRSSKSYSLVSIAGLAIGICCALFIALYVFDELSYDQFHDKKDRIYRMTEMIDHNGEIHAALTSVPVGPTYAAEYPEIENYVRFMWMGGPLTVKVGEKVYRENNLWYSDSTLFDVMSFKLLHGDSKEALKAPHSVVITEELAAKFFEAPEKALGQSIRLGTLDFNVTGVIENSPSNSDIVYSAFVSITSVPEQQMQALTQDWFRLTCYTFLLFDNPVAEGSFRTKMDEFSKRHVDPFVETFGGNSSARFDLQPLNKLHFDNSREYDTAKGNPSYISIFIILALFILTIACINYVNLSLSQSIKRAKEVGVRKTLGARPHQIRFQFLGESILISLIALFLGIALVEVLLTPFNSITSKSFELLDVFDLKMMGTMLGIILLVGILSGIYPAIVLSSFDASNILRGSLPKLGKFGNLRRVLMLVQFAFSLFMIIGTISIFSQMKYLQEKELGFDKDQLVIITIPQDTAVYNKLSYLKDVYLNNPNVKGITGSSGIPGGRTGEIMFRVEQDVEMVEKNIKFMRMDEDFLGIMGIDLLKGRNFSKDIQTDQREGFIVNETALKQFGWMEEPLGKRVQWGLQPNGGAAFDGKVVGVVEDFHFASLHNPLEPLVIGYSPNNSLLFSVKLAGGNIQSSLDFLEDEWSKFAGNNPFEYQFLDDRIETQYAQENTLLTVFGYFSVLSIFIAALGLFALTSFTVEQRMKEFSVRKVLGAKVSDLGKLLGKEFVVLLLIAVVLIAPLAYYAINIWLANFSYRISIPWFSFLAAALLSLLITTLTISYHIWQLSKANPARTLRME